MLCTKKGTISKFENFPPDTKISPESHYHISIFLHVHPTTIKISIMQTIICVKIVTFDSTAGPMPIQVSVSS